MKPLVVGNWKMHRTEGEAGRLAREIRRRTASLRGVEIVLAPAFTALGEVREALRGSRLALAAQNMHWELEGAFTGEISPKMLLAAGCRFVIIGHSERRRLFAESNEVVAKKVRSALLVGLRPILCVGETWEERRAGKTMRVVAGQLKSALKGLEKGAIKQIAVAYEPVWAIGTGRNATPDQASEVHLAIRALLENLVGKTVADGCRILYGGSVRPDNAPDLSAAPGVNGVLVGGASLKAKDFLAIARCFVR